MDTIRIETDHSSGMSQINGWLSRHRNEVVRLDSDRNLTLGVPITGARAVIVAAVLDNGVGGVLRALANFSGPPVRLVFDIRSRGGLETEAVRLLGAEALDSISRRIAEEELISRVA